MKSRDILCAAAALAFWLLGTPSANNSEAINVTLPSQYQVIWDQTLAPPPADAIVADRPGTQVYPGSAASFAAGPLARVMARRGTDRG